MRKRFWLLRFLLPLLATALVGVAAAQVRDDAAIVKDFLGKVEHYQSLRDKQGVPTKPTNSADKLKQKKNQAVQKIKDARQAAQQGDIFTPEIASYFKKQIHATLSGPDGKKIYASLRRAEPVPNVHLQVNEKYPSKLPLQSMPPTLLLNLPQLPEGMQYRVVGSTLILYDEASDLVVDLIPNAIA